MREVSLPCRPYNEQPFLEANKLRQFSELANQLRAKFGSFFANNLGRCLFEKNLARCEPYFDAPIWPFILWLLKPGLFLTINCFQIRRKNMQFLIWLKRAIDLWPSTWRANISTDTIMDLVSESGTFIDTTIDSSVFWLYTWYCITIKKNLRHKLKNMTN